MLCYNFCPYESTFITNSLHPLPIFIAMAAATTTLTSSGTPEHRSNSIQPNGHAMSDTPIHANGHSPSPGTKEFTPPILRHVAVVHSKNKTSCLSHDSAEMPSFLGFRNLMVIVLSRLCFLMASHVSMTDLTFAVVMNLRLVIENHQKVCNLIDPLLMLKDEDPSVWCPNLYPLPRLP